MPLNQNRLLETLVRKYNLLANKKLHRTPMYNRLMIEPGDINDLQQVPYRELVALLLFISRYTRPDIAYAVNVHGKSSYMVHNGPLESCNKCIEANLITWADNISSIYVTRQKISN